MRGRIRILRKDGEAADAGCPIAPICTNKYSIRHIIRSALIEESRLVSCL